MGAAFLITLREGLEIALVLAILVSYLFKSGRRDSVSDVWRGGILAVSFCVVAGLLFHWFVGEFEGKSEQFIEGTIAIVAAAVLTWMIFWMRTRARTLKKTLENQVESALAGGSSLGLAAVAFASPASISLSALTVPAMRFAIESNSQITFT